jgi:hypothetical protein
LEKEPRLGRAAGDGRRVTLVVTPTGAPHAGRADAGMAAAVGPIRVTGVAGRSGSTVMLPIVTDGEESATGESSTS